MIVVRWVGIVLIVLGCVALGLTLLAVVFRFSAGPRFLHAGSLLFGLMRAFGYFVIGGICIWLSKAKA